MTVTELTVACAGSSMALAAIPGDTTTPVANKIMDLSSYLLIIVVLMFLVWIVKMIFGVKISIPNHSKLKKEKSANNFDTSIDNEN